MKTKVISEINTVPGEKGIRKWIVLPERFGFEIRDTEYF